MEHIIGMDLGATYSCTACIERKEPKVIVNLHDLSITSSFVSFASNGGEFEKKKK